MMLLAGRDALFRGMAFDIHVGGVAHLPDAAKIRRLAVPQAGWSKRPLCLCVTGKSQRCDRPHGETQQSQQKASRR